MVTINWIVNAHKILVTPIALFLSRNGSLPKFPFSGMGRKRIKVSLYGDWLTRYKTPLARIWSEED
jgi:hypothetical protein